MGMTHRFGHIRFAILAGVATFAMTPVASQAAPAQEANFDIAPQELGAALRAYARQTNQEVFFTPDVVNGKRTRGLRGRAVAAKALATLLEGTGLRARMVGERTIYIERIEAVASIASTQDTAGNTADPDPEQGEDIVVTGSRIEGANLRGTLPVTVLGQDRLDAVGAVTTGELTASIPQMAGQAFNNETQGPNAARGDVSSANLRGLGSGNTLALLNGRRLVAHPTTQQEGSVPVQIVNLNTIPGNAIARLEVLRDGAGAIYGSDATAGVLNYTTDLRFEGLELAARYGFSEGTDLDETSISAKWGIRSKDGNTRLAVFADAYFRSALPATDRDYAGSDNLRDRVPAEFASFFDNRSSLSPWTTGRVATPVTGLGASFTSFFVQPCTFTGSRAPVPGNSDVCINGGSTTLPAALRYDEGPERTLTPSSDRYTAMANFSHDFGGVELFTELLYYNAKSVADRGGSTNLATAPLTVGANNPYNPFGSGPGRLPGYAGPAQAVTIVGLRIDDVGPRRIEVASDVGRMLAGFRGDFGGWKWETAALYSWAKTLDSESNRVSNTALQTALNSSDPALAYNPFTGGNLTDPSLLDPSLNPAGVVDPLRITVRRNSNTELYLADAKITNASLFTLRGNDIGIAIGGEFRRETLNDKRDPRVNGTTNYVLPTGGLTSDVLGTSPTLDTVGARNVISAYAELAVPLVTEADAIPLIQNLEVQLAARFEHFYDIDSGVLKPKIAVGWQVTDWLKLRGNYSQGFRAPNLETVNSSEIRRVQENLTDYFLCARAQGVTTIAAINKSACGSFRFNVEDVRSGNRNLKPESVDSISAGIVLTPTRSLTFTVDYWRIKQENIIGIFEAVDHLNLDAVRRLEGNSSDPALIRNALGEPVSVTNQFLNLAARTVEGIDVGLVYNLRDTAVGAFVLAGDLAYLRRFDQIPSPESAELLAAGLPASAGGSLIRQDDNPRVRASGSVSWKSGNVSANLFGSYIGPVEDTSALNYPVDDWFVVNASVRYAFDSGALNGLGVRLGVNNIADTDPPIADETFGYYAGLFNNRGRFLYAQLSYKLW